MTFIGMNSGARKSRQKKAVVEKPAEESRHNVWTAERVERLRLLRQEGLTATQIAQSLGCYLTRNAVIGKCARLGIATPHVPRPKVVRPRQTSIALPKPPSLPKETVAELPFIGPVMDFPDAGKCRYPRGEFAAKDFQCCGHQVRAGSSFCEFHDQNSHDRASTRRANNWLRVPARSKSNQAVIDDGGGSFHG